MFGHTGRTTICSIVFVDIIGFSKVTNAEQLVIKERLEEVIAEAVSRLAEQDCVIVDSGDGAAMCFLGDPEDALFVASAVRKGAAATSGKAAQMLRIGINLGPIKLITDLNGATNIVGDGINVAQRIMSFAGDGEVLVSRSYYEVVSRLREGNECLFQYLGMKKDKHIREHELYTVASDGIQRDASLSDVARRSSDPSPKPRAPVSKAVWVDIEERRLARYVGPLATLIVKRAYKAADCCDAFCEALAAAIPDATKRQAFLDEKRHYRTAVVEAKPVRSSNQEATNHDLLLSESDLATIERQLAEQIGPIAGTVIRRASRHAKSRQQLCQSVAASITNFDGRRRFLANASKQKAEPS